MIPALDQQRGDSMQGGRITCKESKIFTKAYSIMTLIAICGTCGICGICGTESYSKPKIDCDSKK
jgi:hypothetical protein